MTACKRNITKLVILGPTRTVLHPNSLKAVRNPSSKVHWACHTALHVCGAHHHIAHCVAWNRAVFGTQSLWVWQYMLGCVHGVLLAPFVRKHMVYTITQQL